MVDNSDDLTYPTIGFEDLGVYPGYGGGMFFSRNDQSRYPMHRHTELEFNIVVQGTAKYVIEDQQLDVDASSLIWLFPNQNHILVRKSTDFTLWVVHFEQWLLRLACRSETNAPLRQPDRHGVPRCRLDAEQMNTIDTLLRELYRYDVKPNHKDLFNMGLAYIVLYAWNLQLEHGAPDAGRPIHPAVRGAIELIEHEIEPLSQEMIARSVGLSSRRLSDLFREQMGMNLLDFRDHQRLERFFRIYDNCCVKFEHRKGMETVLQSALEAGFGSYPQFHRVFREMLGRSPREYLHDRGDAVAEMEELEMDRTTEIDTATA